METKRFKEELALIKGEMSNLMSFYKDRVIVELKNQKDLLKSQLNGIVEFLGRIFPNQ